MITLDFHVVKLGASKQAKMGGWLEYECGAWICTLTYGYSYVNKSIIIVVGMLSPHMFLHELTLKVLNF